MEKQNITNKLKEKRKQYMKEYNKKYTEVNKVKRKEYKKKHMKKYRKEHRKELSKYDKEYYHKNIDQQRKKKGEYMKKRNRNKNNLCIDCGIGIINSSKRCRICAHKGQNSNLWIHGKYNNNNLYDQNFDNKFKNLIRERDNQVCMMCGKHREKMKRALSVHHINYDKKLSVPQNCVSLCNSCHNVTGIKRKYYQQFFQSILADKYGYIYEEGNIVLEVNIK